jgi:hypothetical protein
MGWQPIESVPQDGTRVLTFDPSYGIAAATFDPYWGWVERGADYATEVWGIGEMHPTHWMPLPTPPKLEP